MFLIRFGRSNVILLLAAAIWGFAFVAQKAGMDYVGPFTFNGIRFTLGCLVLIPIIKRNRFEVSDKMDYLQRHLIIGGLFAGLVLFIGTSFQQIGIIYTSSGKAGFITGLYVILVPIIGLFWKYQTNVLTWVGALLALSGLYFLSVTEKFSILQGDSFILISTVFFALHVIIVGWFSPKVDPFKFSIIQFVVCAGLSFIMVILTEKISWEQTRDAWLPLVYGGVMSVGVGFTLQTIGQKNAKPSSAAIILSLESLFAAVGGWLILNEGFTSRGLLGCGLMLSGIIISQVKKNHSLF